MDRHHDLKKSVVNIYQWNANSLKPKLQEFELLLSQGKIHIAIVSETWLSPENTIKVSNFNIFRTDRDDHYGGICILCHKSIKMCQVNFISPNPSIEIIYVNIFNVAGIKNIIAIYCPPSANTSQSDWDYIFQVANTQSIIAGDFNGHHSLWSYKNDRRGELIYKSMFENNFICLNDGNVTRLRFVNGVIQKSSPDITFASVDIAVKLSWETTQESLGSDHIIISIKYGFERSNTHNKKRNFKMADWDNYTKKSNDIFFDSELTNDIQGMYDTFMNKVNSVAEDTIPWIIFNENPSPKFSPKSYWNPTLSKAVAERRLALKNFRRNPTPANHDHLMLKISQARNLIYKARSKAWNDFCTSIDQETSATEMWRKMRWMKGRFRNFNYDPNKSKELLYSLTPDTVEEPPPILMKPIIMY